MGLSQRSPIGRRRLPSPGDEHSHGSRKLPVSRGNVDLLFPFSFKGAMPSASMLAGVLSLGMFFSFFRRLLDQLAFKALMCGVTA